MEWNMMCGWRLQLRTGSQQLHEMRTRDDPLQDATRDDWELVDIVHGHEL
jgi:hypothetical protein